MFAQIIDQQEQNNNWYRFGGASWCQKPHSAPQSTHSPQFYSSFLFLASFPNCFLSFPHLRLGRLAWPPQCVHTTQTPLFHPFLYFPFYPPELFSLFCIFSQPFPNLRLGRLGEIGLAWPPRHPHATSSQFLIAQRTATTPDQIAQNDEGEFFSTTSKTTT